MKIANGFATLLLRRPTPTQIAAREFKQAHDGIEECKLGLIAAHKLVDYYQHTLAYHETRKARLQELVAEARGAEEAMNAVHRHNGE